jgi:ABC-2 type transport system permease protein
MFFSFIQKEFYHIFRDTRTMLILLGMPVAQIVLFGFAISTEIRNANIAVLDFAKNPATQRAINELQASEYFSVTEIYNPRDIDNIFKRGKASLAIIFQKNEAQPSTFSYQLLTDATDPNQAMMLANYATSTINNEQLKIKNGSANVSQNASLFIVNSSLFNPQMKGAYNFVPGVMGLVLMLICAMMTSIAIVREKEMGTMEVLLASPVKPLYIILAKMVPYFTLSVVNLFSILLLSVYVLDVPIAGSLWLLTLVSLLLMVVSLSVGLLVSNIVSTQVAAMLISGMGLMMPTMLLSGMMFPVESMPKILQWISSIVPARWYIEAVKKVMIQGVGIEYVVQEILVLTGMAGLLLAVSLKKFKIRLN